MPHTERYAVLCHGRLSAHAEYGSCPVDLSLLRRIGKRPRRTQRHNNLPPVFTFIYLCYRFCTTPPYVYLFFHRRSSCILFYLISLLLLPPKLFTDGRGSRSESLDDVEFRVGLRRQFSSVGLLLPPILLFDGLGIHVLDPRVSDAWWTCIVVRNVFDRLAAHGPIMQTIKEGVLLRCLDEIVPRCQDAFGCYATLACISDFLIRYAVYCLPAKHTISTSNENGLASNLTRMSQCMVSEKMLRSLARNQNG